MIILAASAGAPALAEPAAPAPTGATSTSVLLDESRALEQAREKGAPVAVTAATTPTETVTAHPDGSLTLTQAVQPVRKLVDGTWRDLDATLTVSAGGDVVPKTALGGLRLSNGGDEPLAVMSGGGRSLSLRAPFTLPEPTLAGDTATYAEVLPGADLKVTADTQGGFSEVLVVKNATAAADPLVREFAFTTESQGLTLTSDAAGNLVGADVTGRAVMTAAAPRMWDSTAPAAQVRTALDPTTGLHLNRATGQPATSSFRAPGEDARVAPIGVRVEPGKLRLTPPKSLLDRPDLTWPVYIDPTFTWLASGSAASGYAVVSQNRPSENYWKDSPSTSKDMQSGLDPDGGDVRRTLMNFTIDTGKLAGATINDAVLNITETWSYNCTPSKVDLYAPAKDLTSSNATWNKWSDTDEYGSRVAQENVAHGWSSDCKAAGVAFDILSSVKADVAAGNKTRTFVLKANSESSVSGWKRWDRTTPKITIHYNHPPSKPTNLKTSPTTACSGSTVGDTAVKLYATVSDPNGGTVGEKFTIWKTSNSAVTKSSDPNLLTAPSGSSSVPFTIDQAWLRSAAGGVATSFSWNIQITDFKATATSATCKFTWDPTRQGAPTVTTPEDATIGKGAVVTIAKPATGTVPTSYQYQLNGGPFDSVDADAAGNATITVYPRRFTNVVTVTSVSAGGNIGDTAAETFTAHPAAPAMEGDLNGDGTVDLLTVGAVNNLPPGLWLSPGTGSPAPALNLLATNIGSVGNGTQGDNSPANFNGAQAITGRFTGSGLQDVLYYYRTGLNAGGGGILNGSGDGTPIDANQSGNQHTLTAGALSDLNDSNPLTLVNVGLNESGYPDLLGIAGDDTNGYYLNWYPNQGGMLNYAFPTQLTAPAPDGTMNWNSWTITTAQRVSGSTDMFLWNRGTGALHLWTDLTFDINTGTFGYAGAYTLTDGVSTFFVQSTTVSVQAGDINRDGVPDLWTVGSGGAATGWLVGGLTGTTGTITAQAAQTLNTSAHTWQLNDAAEGAVGDAQAKDTVGTLHGTGSGGVVWNTGDLFDPDAEFDGVNDVITMPKAVSTTGDFSVSLWTKPTAYSGNVISQDGKNGVGFKIWPSSDTTWCFAMQKGDTAFTSAEWDTAKSSAGAAKLNVWYQITATYQASTRKMSLYINDRLAGTATRSTSWAADGSFRIGTMRTSSTTHGYYYKGQVANVQTWNTVINPLSQPQRALWDRTQQTTGVWATNGAMIDANRGITNTAAAALPDGTTHVFTVLPNWGIYERIRAADGTWSGSATRVDTQGLITHVAAAATPDGKLHLVDIVPDSGIWYRSRSAAGVWDAGATKIDANGAISAVSLAGLPNNTVAIQTLVPNSGIWYRTRSAAGVWGTAATKIDTTTTIVDVASAALPDGTLHQFTVVPGEGIYLRSRTAAGVWGTGTTKVDQNGSVTQVSVAGGADGRLRMTTTLPSSGLWHFARSTSGTWSGGKIDYNPKVLDTYTVVPKDGTVHVGSIPDN